MAKPLEIALPYWSNALSAQVGRHTGDLLIKYARTTRMPSLIVYGDSGMGKSMLVDKFKADCAAGCATDSTPNPNKVLVVELSGRPTERRLFSQILATVDAPHSPRASIVDVERGAINTLRDIGVQILVLDEIHNILAGSWREQRIVLNTLRFLSNELNFARLLRDHGGERRHQRRRSIGATL